MKVAHVHNGYPEDRNIKSVQDANVKFIKVYDIFKFFDFFYFKLFKKTNLFFHNSFSQFFSFPKADVYHFFNGISYGTKPWISTFETILPRYNQNYKLTYIAVKAMAKPNCKKLIAFSKFNKELQITYLRNNFPEHADSIISKIEVIYPPQSLINDGNMKRFENTDSLKVLFVGHDFFRKGGREVFRAIEQLVNKGASIELTIVSKLNTDNWISFTNKNDKIDWKLKLENTEFCRYFDYLPNHEVLNLTKNAHILMLPSLQETFGYSVLEAQSCGTPVVTTSIRAFPEINNNECGWVIDVPQTEKGMVDISLGHDYISNIIIEQLKEIIISLTKEELHIKSKKSIDRISGFHNIENFSKKNAEIYFDSMRD